MPDVKAYAVGDATALTALAENTDLMTLLPAGEYNLTLDATATVTIPALTAGSIVQTLPEIGDTLTVTGSNAPATGIAYQWQQSADGSTGWANITGATAATLDTSSGVTDDYYVRRGVEITSVQSMVYTTAVQVGGVAAPSSAIETAVTASTSTAFWAPTDGALLFQDSGLTTAAASDNDPVGGIDVATGDVNILQPTSGERPTRDNASGLLDFADGNTLDAALATRSADMYFACVVNTTDLRGIVAASSTVAGSYFGLYWSGGNNGIALAGVGTPTIKVDGATVADNRNTLHAALCDGADHVLEFSGLDLSSADFGTLTIGTNGNVDNNFVGFLGDFVLCDTPDAASQTAIREELAGRHSITLP